MAIKENLTQRSIDSLFYKHGSEENKEQIITAAEQHAPQDPYD